MLLSSKLTECLHTFCTTVCSLTLLHPNSNYNSEFNSPYYKQFVDSSFSSDLSYIERPRYLFDLRHDEYRVQPVRLRDTASKYGPFDR